MILRLRRGRSVHGIEVVETEGGSAVTIDGRPFEADVRRLPDGTWSVLSGGRSIEVVLAPEPDGWTAWSGGRRYRLRAGEAAPGAAAEEGGAGGPREVRATLPGKILQVEVEPGSRVREGDGLVVIEAMKMENELRAPYEARVASVAVSAGQTVETGALLLVLEPLSAAAAQADEPEE